RPEIRDCPSALPRFQPSRARAPGDECGSDADCTAKPLGYCTASVNLGGTTYLCAYGCAKDQECGAGRICFCGDPVGRCVEASCTSDQSCGGMLCAWGASASGGCQLAFACQRHTDRCATSRDCAGGSQQYCAISAAGRACAPR